MTDRQTARAKDGVADIQVIMEMIPHRYPFLLIDKVVEIIADEGAVGLKNVSINEHFFQGHFPRQPVFPGVLIVEAMAQTAAVLVVETLEGGAAGKLVYFMGIDKCKFRRPVGPGDVLELHVKKDKQRGPVWRFSGKAKVGDTLVAEAEFGAMIMDEKAAP